MRPDPKTNPYYSYLLRVWRVNSQPPRWQVSLRDARTGESFNFADLQQLKNFLDQRIDNNNPQEKPRN
jgi:hypothetical protein